MTEENVLQYRVIDYFDVWNEGEEDGQPQWSVNNLADIGTLELPDNRTQQDIITALIEFGFLNEKANLQTITTEDDYEMVELFDATNYNHPLCRLELIQK